MIFDKSDEVILVGTATMLFAIIIFIYDRNFKDFGLIIFLLGIIIYLKGQSMCPSRKKKKVKYGKGST